LYWFVGSPLGEAREENTEFQSPLGTLLARQEPNCWIDSCKLVELTSHWYTIWAEAEPTIAMSASGTNIILLMIGR